MRRRDMDKDFLLKEGQKISAAELDGVGWLLLMHLPNGTELYSRHDVKIIWDPLREEVIHLFTTVDMYRDTFYKPDKKK